MATKCIVADPLELMCRYLDGKDDLSPDEKEILMFALYCESKDREGNLVQQAIKKLGVWVAPARARAERKEDGREPKRL